MVDLSLKIKTALSTRGSGFTTGWLSEPDALDVTKLATAKTNPPPLWWGPCLVYGWGAACVQRLIPARGRAIALSTAQVKSQTMMPRSACVQGSVGLGRFSL